MGDRLYDRFMASALALFMIGLVVVVTLVALWLPALVPARLAPQLQVSPVGTFISITSHELDTGVWRVDYPSAWRVVKTSIAPDPIQVVFVSPDDMLTITLGEPVLDEADTVRRVGGVLVYAQAQASAQATPAQRQALERHMAMMLASLRPSQP